MQDAKYFRGQAELCLDIARQMSDGALAERMRDRAAQHFARAVELETRSPGVCGQLPPTRHNGSTFVRRFYFSVDYDGTLYDDETGEVFLTLQDAEAYAEIVARELGRNNHKSVEVFLVGDDGARLGSFPG